MRVMITGGLGFIGSHLADELIKNNKLMIISKSLSKKNNIANLKGKIQLEKIDIRNFKKLGNSIEKFKPDVIIHLAGQTSHSKSFINPLYDIDTNAKSTLFILEKIRKLDLKCRFVLGSTFVVVGRPTKLPVNENTPCNPTTIYGVNRLASEQYCKIYHDVYGMDNVMFRITNSFGPREQYVPIKNAVNFLIYQAFKGKNITIYDDGKFFRDLIYVSDVVDAISMIIKKGKSGNLYWISSGEKTWFYKLGKWLEELSSAKVRYIHSPTYTKKVDVGNFVVDNSKLKLLGWKKKVSIKKGIYKTLVYMEENKKLK